MGQTQPEPLTESVKSEINPTADLKNGPQSDWFRTRPGSGARIQKNRKLKKLFEGKPLSTNMQQVV